MSELGAHITEPVVVEIYSRVGHQSVAFCEKCHEILVFLFTYPNAQARCIRRTELCRCRMTENGSIECERKLTG